jgi:hypothetical protein
VNVCEELTLAFSAYQIWVMVFPLAFAVRPVQVFEGELETVIVSPACTVQAMARKLAAAVLIGAVVRLVTIDPAATCEINVIAPPPPVTCRAPGPGKPIV